MRHWLLLCAALLIPAFANAAERSAKAERFCDQPPCYPGYEAHFTEPVTRYAHGVLGDAVEWGTLRLGEATVRLSPSSVFEDLVPRLVDVDGDGAPEAVVIESHADMGAQLAIYQGKGSKLRKIAATPHIGTRYRWLAPAGIADFDGNGTLDFAYVDRPHLAKTLRIWSYEQGKLREKPPLQALPITGSGRISSQVGSGRCDGPEIVVADAHWSRVMGLRFEDEQWVARVLAQPANAQGFAKALSCR